MDSGPPFPVPLKAPKHLLVGGRRHGGTFTGHVGSSPAPLIRAPVLPPPGWFLTAGGEPPPGGYTDQPPSEVYYRRWLCLGGGVEAPDHRQIAVYVTDEAWQDKRNLHWLVLEAALIAAGVDERPMG